MGEETGREEMKLEEKWIRWRGNNDVDVSTDGRVRRWRGTLSRLLDKPEEANRWRTGSMGYWQVCVGGEKLYVHRMVCEAWQGKGKEGEVVRHLNGDVGDNRVENLMWAAKREGDGVVREA